MKGPRGVCTMSNLVRGETQCRAERSTERSVAGGGVVAGPNATTIGPHIARDRRMNQRTALATFGARDRTGSGQARWPGMPCRRMRRHIHVRGAACQPYAV